MRQKIQHGYVLAEKVRQNQVVKIIRVAVFVILHLRFMQGNAQSEYVQTKQLIPIDTIAITRDFEKFDEARYQRLKTEESVMASETTKEHIYVEILKTTPTFSFRETRPSSYFSLLKIYYTDGNIKSKGAYFNVPWGGFKKGVWYEFSEDGKLVKDTNYDKDYPFTFENVLAFCKKENIPLTEGAVRQITGYHTSVLRNTSTGKSKWIIRWLKTPDLQEEITLNGETGAVIQRRESNYINN